MTSLLEENGTVKGVLYKNKAGEEFKAFAPLTIVCDGCFSNLRKSLCSPKVTNIMSIIHVQLLGIQFLFSKNSVKRLREFCTFAMFLFSVFRGGSRTKLFMIL